MRDLSIKLCRLNKINIAQTQKFKGLKGIESNLVRDRMVGKLVIIVKDVKSRN